jgi:Zn-dependent protease
MCHALEVWWLSNFQAARQKRRNLNIGPAQVGEFILSMVAFLFSASVHESAHAWTSSHFGDDLARSQGRISLNPLVHIDPIGTLLFPAIAFFTGARMLGWAKSTPVNPLAWRNKRVANFWVSSAGVICNFVMAIVSGILLRILLEFGLIAVGDGQFIPATTNSMVAVGAVSLLFHFFLINVTLGAFNLIPIPPLDGSGVLSSLLPPSFEEGMEQFQRFGFLLLFVAVYTGIVSLVLRPVISIAITLLMLGTGY